jgi:hypothetical protein
MSASRPALAVADGLLERFRSAAGQIEWRPAKGRSKRGTKVRIAHLFQEEARVETREGPDGLALAVDSGPVGALVLLLEADRRGAPRLLLAQNAGRDAAFPSGALVAVWGALADPPADGTVRVADLVELARYALP